MAEARKGRSRRLAGEKESRRRRATRSGMSDGLARGAVKSDCGGRWVDAWQGGGGGSGSAARRGGFEKRAVVTSSAQRRPALRGQQLPLCYRQQPPANRDDCSAARGLAPPLGHQ